MSTLLLHPSQPPAILGRGQAETGHLMMMNQNGNQLSNESLLRQIGLQPSPPQLLQHSFPGSLLAHADAPYPLASLQLGQPAPGDSASSDDDGRPGRQKKPQMQGRFSGRLPLKEDERRLAEECRLLAPYLGGVGKRGDRSRLTLAKIVRGISSGAVRRFCEEREALLAILGARLQAIDSGTAQSDLRDQVAALQGELEAVTKRLSEVDPNPAQTQSLIAAVRAAHPPRPPTVYEQYASILARHQAYMPGHHQSNPNNAMVGGGRGPVGLPFSTLMPSSSPHHHHHHGPGGAQHPQPMVVVINATPGMEGQGAGAPGTASWGAAVAAAALGAARQGGHQLQTVTLPAPAGASGGGLAHAGASATGINSVDVNGSSHTVIMAPGSSLLPTQLQQVSQQQQDLTGSAQDKALQQHPGNDLLSSQPASTGAATLSSVPLPIPHTSHLPSSPRHHPGGSAGAVTGTRTPSGNGNEAREVSGESAGNGGAVAGGVATEAAVERDTSSAGGTFALPGSGTAGTSGTAGAVHVKAEEPQLEQAVLEQLTAMRSARTHGQQNSPSASQQQQQTSGGAAAGAGAGAGQSNGAGKRSLQEAHSGGAGDKGGAGAAQPAAKRVYNVNSNSGSNAAMTTTVVGAWPQPGGVPLQDRMPGAGGMDGSAMTHATQAPFYGTLLPSVGHGHLHHHHHHHHSSSMPSTTPAQDGLAAHMMALNQQQHQKHRQQQQQQAQQQQHLQQQQQQQQLTSYGGPGSNAGLQSLQQPNGVLDSHQLVSLYGGTDANMGANGGGHLHAPSNSWQQQLGQVQHMMPPASAPMQFPQHSLNPAPQQQQQQQQVLIQLPGGGVVAVPQSSLISTAPAGMQAGLMGGPPSSQPLMLSSAPDAQPQLLSLGGLQGGNPGQYVVLQLPHQQ